MRVAVVGAGIIGAACASALARAGLDVEVVERGTVASGTTSGGEGNLLVSDKGPGPELAMALRSLELWHRIADELDGDSFELERKGGLVVAQQPEGLLALAAFADEQRAAGVRVEPVDEAGLLRLEPHLRRALPGGAFYPDDAQVQPMLAAARLVQDAVAHGARTHFGTEVVGVAGSPSRITGLRTTRGPIDADVVVNAAGPWAGAVADLLGAPIDVRPRRGFVLVTEPLPPTVHHKVYAADYVVGVASDAAALTTSSVIEATKAGTVLIGASREQVGFDSTPSPAVVRRLAAGAVALFPVLRGARLLRTYHGFRPYSPDHLPVVGPDPRVAGLVHATGHEGAGVVLAPATAELVTQLVTGADPTLDPRPFRPERLEASA
jgi:glycine/D-amino acid oxidase-like deaminating enzyme